MSTVANVFGIIICSWKLIWRLKHFNILSTTVIRRLSLKPVHINDFSGLWLFQKNPSPLTWTCYIFLGHNEILIFQDSCQFACFFWFKQNISGKFWVFLMKEESLIHWKTNFIMKFNYYTQNPLPMKPVLRGCSVMWKRQDWNHYLNVSELWLWVLDSSVFFTD